MDLSEIGRPLECFCTYTLTIFKQWRPHSSLLQGWGAQRGSEHVDLVCESKLDRYMTSMNLFIKVVYIQMA